MTTTRSEQESILAVHRRQLDGYMQTIASVEAAKANGSIDAELADSQIERWSIFAAATQDDIDDCLRNIAELDAPPVEASVGIPFQGAHSLPHEPTLLAVADAMRNVLEPIPEPTIVDDEAPAPAKTAEG